MIKRVADVFCDASALFRNSAVYIPVDSFININMSPACDCWIETNCRLGGWGCNVKQCLTEYLGVANAAVVRQTLDLDAFLCTFQSRLCIQFSGEQ
jgi:hypothetical protein